MNSFISSLYILLDVIKAFGPVLASGFLGWVAYNQFKLAKSQSKISQEQLALVKQQADIAQRKVELDIRDKKYEVFRRWNEAYYCLLNDILSKRYLYLARSKTSFTAVSDELFFSFEEISNIHKRLDIVRETVEDILFFRKQFEVEHGIDFGKTGLSISHEFLLEINDKYYPQLEKKIELLNQYRNQLLDELAKEVNISNYRL